ncbi:unnamed protein product [Pleuronectes platessa]|uniref:Uncharacterized protein n=1 Tax=Pleuronectes platessa TaxID=8262 RepID=A0A9N7TS84_PLEPL|nr:unnamed protein product [Pleuronectes platessa]
MSLLLRSAESLLLRSAESLLQLKERTAVAQSDPFPSSTSSLPPLPPLPSSTSSSSSSQHTRHLGFNLCLRLSALYIRGLLQVFTFPPPSNQRPCPRCEDAGLIAHVYDTSESSLLLAVNLRRTLPPPTLVFLCPQHPELQAFFFSGGLTLMCAAMFDLGRGLECEGIKEFLCSHISALLSCDSRVTTLRRAEVAGGEGEEEGGARGCWVEHQGNALPCQAALQLTLCSTWKYLGCSPDARQAREGPRCFGKIPSR